jgi:hypothetical protein
MLKLKANYTGRGRDVKKPIIWDGMLKKPLIWDGMEMLKKPIHPLYVYNKKR